jgi:hypothetical protein
MKKSDLKTGMSVELRSGAYGIVMGNAILTLDIDHIASHGGCDLSNYADDMKYTYDSRLDIIKVFKEREKLSGSDINFKVSSLDRFKKYFIGDLIWKREDYPRYFKSKLTGNIFRFDHRYKCVMVSVGKPHFIGSLGCKFESGMDHRNASLWEEVFDYKAKKVTMKDVYAKFGEVVEVEL